MSRSALSVASLMLPSALMLLMVVSRPTHAWMTTTSVWTKQQRRIAPLSMVSTSPQRPSSTTSAVTADAFDALQTKGVYPTRRGSPVDARQIVKTGAAVEAVLLRHVLLQTEEMALASYQPLRAGTISLEELARQVSDCQQTRDEGGLIGWVKVVDNNHPGREQADGDPNEHLDGILPAEARQQLLHLNSKPGDIVLIESTLGHHLVQTVDILHNVRSMAQLRPRRRPKNMSEEQPHVSPSRKLERLLLGGLEAEEVPTLTYQLETMGCQMNMADSERIEGQLQSLGLVPISENGNNNKKKKKEYPDVVVLNTCSIRDHAEQKVYSYLGSHARRKREGDDVVLVVAGCVAQQQGQELLRRVPELDLVMGPQYSNRMGDFLYDVVQGNQVVATEASHIMEDSTKPRRQSTVAAWVNVIYGCNERCAFCIVPTTRGVEQSRPVESIVQEVSDLVADGYKEVTLLGQNIDAYGRDMIPKRKFSDLIRTVGSIPGLERLRFVTSHPRYMSMGVVDAVAETPAACESFHIPFQSGSNQVLAAMGRGHTREKYLRIVDRIRSRIPDAAITADVIVGFPGETEEQFEETLSLMREVVFDSVNTAAYSPRPNTPAATWDNQVDEGVKQERLMRINRLNLQHAATRRQRMMGQTVEVLLEERNVKDPTQVMGRTRHGYIVYVQGDIDELRGQTVEVKIDTCQTYYLAGTRVQ